MSNTITSQEILDFISKQPDDRPINFRENYSDESCGCVMIHYGKDVLKMGDFSCGYDTFHDKKSEVYRLENDIFLMLGMKYSNLDEIKTYGQLKQHLMSKQA